MNFQKAAIISAAILLTIACGSSKQKMIVPLSGLIEEPVSSANNANSSLQTTISVTNKGGSAASDSNTAVTNTSAGSSASSDLTVSGTVTGNSGAPVAGANVVVSEKNPETGVSTVVFETITSATGTISGTISVPSSSSELVAVITVSANSSGTSTGSSVSSSNTSTQVVISVPSSGQTTTSTSSCGSESKKEKDKTGDHDRGHGNDEDGYDEDNPGRSTGVNTNGLRNR